MIPGLRPPKVRQALISEMQAEGGDPDALLAVDGEVHFVQYGSKDLHIEMSSLIPKQDWVTVVLLGKSVDRARPSEFLGIMQQFVELPHIRRLLPPGVRLRPGCSCHPNMTVGAASEPFGTRVALTGDLAVSRLYKDGLYSAWTTSAALADCILERGVDRDSLRRGYAPVVQGVRPGQPVRPGDLPAQPLGLLPPGAQQGPLPGRPHRAQDHPPGAQWRLATVLWQIASGDESYRRIFGAMLHPASGWLDPDRRPPRHDTKPGDRAAVRAGLEGHRPASDRRVARRSRAQTSGTLLGPRARTAARAPEMERMYSIRIRAERGRDLPATGQIRRSGPRVLQAALCQRAADRGSAQRGGDRSATRGSGAGRGEPSCSRSPWSCSRRCRGATCSTASSMASAGQASSRSTWSG